MNQTQTEQMNASRQFCTNEACKARGKIGQGNIVIHSRQRPRYRCRSCGNTFSAKEGTMFAGLRKPTELIVTVVTLLAHSCPVQANVHALGVDERTVARGGIGIGSAPRQNGNALNNEITSTDQTDAHGPPDGEDEEDFKG